MVIRVCRTTDKSFSEEQIKAWNRRFKETEDAAPDAIAVRMIEGAKDVPVYDDFLSKLLFSGRFWVWYVSTAPL
jgi:hypothetical protein